VPVERSTRHTVFQGRRQIDRAALRRVAADLGWHDGDIVDQAGEGGVEARSHCPLVTRLAFHHQGLIAEADAAAKVIVADMAEGWVDAPTRHLPFVPCRLLPRSVVMQERARLVPSPDGGEPTVEPYLKPRVTLDASDGGDDAVNAAVETRDRATQLPTAQQHARGLAICDSAGDEWHDQALLPLASQRRAVSYVVDAESAYRFCPVQTADLWTQCFVWWGSDGTAGVCVDHRLGFGGAFAPNRFQRISTLVAAHIQAKLAAFDATQPVLDSVRRWTAERADLQRRGELPPSASQLAPRYIQVYIDVRRRAHTPRRSSTHSRPPPHPSRRRTSAARHSMTW
jgi:hypothetical protein